MARISPLMKYGLIGLAVSAGIVLFFAMNQPSPIQYTRVSPDKIDPRNDKSFVFVQGRVTGAQTLEDPDFKVSADGLMMVRDVQRHVTAQLNNGMQVETWMRVTQQDASGPFSGKIMKAPARIGEFAISEQLLGIGTHGLWKRVPVKDLDNIPASKVGKLALDESGDIRVDKGTEKDRKITFSVLPDPGEVSILAMQSGKDLLPFGQVGVFMSGNQPVEALMQRLPIKRANLGPFSNPVGVVAFMAMIACGIMILFELVRGRMRRR